MKTDDDTKGFTRERWHRPMICVKENERGRELASFKDIVDASIWIQENYIKKNNKKLTKGSSNSTNDIKTHRRITKIKKH